MVVILHFFLGGYLKVKIDGTAKGGFSKGP